jgi:hypothetical protein
MIDNENIDILGNMKVMESYKTYLLSAVADLYSTMSKGNKADMEDIVEELADIAMLSYLLGKRLGINYSTIDDSIIKKLRLGILEENNIERDYQDYSKLISYLKDGREI